MRSKGFIITRIAPIITIIVVLVATAILGLHWLVEAVRDGEKFRIAFGGTTLVTAILFDVWALRYTLRYVWL